LPGVAHDVGAAFWCSSATAEALWLEQVQAERSNPSRRRHGLARRRRTCALYICAQSGCYVLVRIRRNPPSGQWSLSVRTRLCRRKTGAGGYTRERRLHTGGYTRGYAEPAVRKAKGTQASAPPQPDAPRSARAPAVPQCAPGAVTLCQELWSLCGQIRLCRRQIDTAVAL
jgi:hypothetical protein